MLVIITGPMLWIQDARNYIVTSTTKNYMKFLKDIFLVVSIFARQKYFQDFKKETTIGPEQRYDLSFTRTNLISNEGLRRPFESPIQKDEKS